MKLLHISPSGRALAPPSLLLLTIALGASWLPIATADPAAREINSVAESDAHLVWDHLPGLPNKLGVAGPFVGIHKDALLVAGGANFPEPVWENEKQWHDEVYVLEKSPAGCSWTRATPLPKKIAYGASVSTPWGVLCMGGNDAEHTFRDVFLLQWNSAQQVLEITEFPALPSPCAYGQATLVGTTVYLAGGQSGQELTSAMRNFWRLDLSKRETPEFGWESLEGWPGESRSLNITVQQNNGSEACVYVISGRRQTGEQVEFLRDTWEYRPRTSSWHRRAEVPRPVMAGIGVGYGTDSVYILGGADGSLFYRADELRDRHPGFPKEAFVFDTLANEWNRAGEIPANHVTTQAVVWGESIIIPSGEVRPRVRSPNVWRVQVQR